MKNVKELVKQARREGDKNEIKYLIFLINSDCKDCLETKEFLQNRLKELDLNG